jgi:hypothetical protein
MGENISNDPKRYKMPKRHTKYVAIKYSKCPKDISNDHNLYQMTKWHSK